MSQTASKLLPNKKKSWEEGGGKKRKNQAVKIPLSMVQKLYCKLRGRKEKKKKNKTYVATFSAYMSIH